MQKVAQRLRLSLESFLATKAVLVNIGHESEANLRKVPADGNSAKLFFR